MKDERCTLNWMIDVIIAAIVLIFLFIGMKKGLIRQVLEILGIIAAFIGAFYLAHHLAAYLEGRFDLPYQVALVVAAIALFIGIILLFRLLGVLLQKFAQLTLLGSLDRIGGAFLGAVKGILLVSLLLVVILNLPFPTAVKEPIKSDPLAAVIYPALPVLFDLVLSRSPAHLDFRKVVRDRDEKALQKVKEKVEDAGEEIEKQKKKVKGVT
jgi:membrane protein required for colicin V production